MPSTNRLSIHAQNIPTFIQGMALGFDRYSFWIDHPAPELPAAQIEKHCARLVITENRSIKYQTLWQTHVQIFQPTRKASQLLATAINKRRFRTRPEYAEIALDHITATRRNANVVRDFLLAHMLVPHARSEVVCEQTGTFYFHRRADQHGNKTPHVIVLYADKRSKLPGELCGERCSHLEHRFSGSDALSDIGINCIGDFAAFAHDTFWRQHLRLCTLPSKAKLGRFLVPSNAECSGTALRKRANKFLQPFFLDNVMVLQNVRMKHPKFDELLRSLENSILLPNEALK